MKRILLLALILAACQGHWAQKWPAPVRIRPAIAPPTVAVDAPLLWTPTPEPER